jgi:hypothetical protein
MNQITKNQAELLAQRLESSLTKIEEDFNEIDEYLTILVEHQAWTALGYSSFEEMFVARKYDRFRLLPGVRIKITKWLKEGSPELSVRRMAEIMGVPKSTTQRDLTAITSAVPNGTPTSPENVPIPAIPKIKPAPKPLPPRVLEGTIDKPAPPIKCPTCGK